VNIVIDLYVVIQTKKMKLVEKNATYWSKLTMSLLWESVSHGCNNATSV